MPSIDSGPPQDLFGWPTAAEREEMRLLGLESGAVGDDGHGNLVRRMSDGSLEIIEEPTAD